MIEQLAAKSVTEIFAEDGEEEFRQLETQVLMVRLRAGRGGRGNGWRREGAMPGWCCRHAVGAGAACASQPVLIIFCPALPLRPPTHAPQELAPFKNCVVSTGGGVPTRAENWGHMQGGISVWLNGPPTLLARRVTRDGTDSRPLLSQVGGRWGEAWPLRWGLS